MLYLLIVGNLVMALTYIWKMSTLPPQIPLFYSRPWGEEQLVDNWLIVILPLFTIIFFFVNTFLYQRYFLTDRFARNIFKTVNVIVIISCTLIFMKIMFLVT
jgi:hypothetical protein